MAMCPYHGGQKPCWECLTNGPPRGPMGEFALYNPGRARCRPHDKPNPCRVCFDSQQGEFAPRGAPVAQPLYVLPIRRPVHYRQRRWDTCAVACCGMVGANLNCPRRFGIEELEAYMLLKGVYREGKKSIFHALNKPLDWLGLECKMRERISVVALSEIVSGPSVVILESTNHVIVIFGVNSDGSFILCDPARSNCELTVLPSDKRLSGTGRIWEIRRK